MWPRFILAVWFIVPVAAQTSQPSPDVLCVYPLSGVYAPLQRILFYTLLAFGVIGRRQRWLVAGALASAMTYCGAAAIHSFFLVANARSSVIDLDIYGVFAATSTGIMLTAPLLAWSTTLQTVEKEIRTIITLWALLILVGAVLAVATIYIQGSVKGPPCYDSLVDIPSTGSTLNNLPANCTFVCHPEEHPLARSPGDILAWKNQLDAPSHITAVFVPTIATAIPAAVITWARFIRNGHSYLVRPPPIFSRLELGWVRELLFDRRRRDLDDDRHPSSFTRIHSTGAVPVPVRYPTLLLVYQYYFVLGSFGVFVVNLVMNEVRFQPLPTNEMPYEVGQWSPWVGVGLILLAQVLSQLLKGGWKRKGQGRGRGGAGAGAGDEEELRSWGRKEIDMRPGTFRSERSTFRRRNSF